MISELTTTECQDLLDKHHFGRLAFVDQVEQIPLITPVNYLTHEGKVVFRTDPGGKLTAALNDAPVAFEVDGIQAHERTGWSVVLLGRLEPVTDSTEIEALLKTPLVPWAPGAKQHYVRITPDRLTGRRVSVADLPSNWWG
jgi:nitroimidazol reductase NimA-like FMN-containing flavoprotein (pyridoxamine 5'-phosphate oxidase superfamily)